jgi:hypothetical protein
MAFLLKYRNRLGLRCAEMLLFLPASGGGMVMIRSMTLAVFASVLCGFAVAQTATMSPSAGSPLNIPGDTVILAKLSANLDLLHCTPGQQLEAQTTADVKQGKTVLLKKGSTLTGHVASVQPATANQTGNGVVIVFDGAQAKNGPSGTLHMVIRALAPEEEGQANSTIAGGRGMPGEDTHAATGGGDHAEEGGVPRLNTSSVGVSGIPGLQLEIRKSTTGEQMTALTWSKGEVKLKKSTQIAFLVVGQ